MNNTNKHAYMTTLLTHHENEENEEDKRGEVDGSEHWVRLLNLWELKVSQDDTELGKTTQETGN